MTGLLSRPRSRVASLWDSFTSLKEVMNEKGVLIPIPAAAALLGVSRPRVDQLLAATSLEGFEFHGHTYVTERSLMAWAERERQVGRPPKVAESLRERVQASVQAGVDVYKDLRKAQRKASK